MWHHRITSGRPRAYVMGLIATLVLLGLAFPAEAQRLRAKRALPRGKTPTADEGVASVIFVYYADSKFKRTFQENVKFKLAMEGYDYRVLLKHDVTKPIWDLAEKDEKMANVIDTPTKANLKKYLERLADDGYVIDLWIFSHGFTGGFIASPGRYGRNKWVPFTESDIRGLTGPHGSTGYARLPLHLVYQINCYANSLSSAWRAVGAKTVTGARYINWFPNQFGRFARLWNRGERVERALQVADNGPSRTLVHKYILADARFRKWGGCPLGRTVLSKHKCAKKYFKRVWGIEDAEWRDGKSGKNNMYHQSQKVVHGDRNMTKRTKPSWR